jgi:signal transduction histidine kinase
MIGTGRLANASIRARVWQLAGLACAALLALGLLLAWSLERNREANALVEHSRIVLKAFSTYTRGMVDAETGQRGYLLTGDETYLTPYADALANNQSRLEQLQALISGPIEQQKIRRLAEILDDKLHELTQTIQLARGGDRAAALAIVIEGRGHRDALEFRRLSGEIVDYEEGVLTQRAAEADDENWNIRLGMAIGGVLAVLLILGAAARTVARIQGPLRELMLGIAALAEGQLGRRVEVRSRDEIGKVANAFNDMADRLLAANRARERGEANLARSNQQLLQEVEERAAAQKRLSRTSDELRRSNQELDNFAYAASHDLKAPLRGIRNLTEWITADVKATAGEDTIKNLALLHSRVGRLDMLLESLLQHSRVGRVGAAAEDIDLAELVQEIADYIAPRPGFSVTYRGQIACIRTSKAPLEQVLRNLIGNGLKHHDREAGAVTISARDLGDTFEFRVEDDGPGIAPAFHERIFQMFQTLKSRDELEGSGMGLAIVKKSVEGRGGAIRIESAPPHRGTAFIFTWEEDRAPAAPAALALAAG